MRSQFRKVLIVDDCEIILARLTKDLRNEGFIVKTACDGAEALGVFPEFDPDFVLTDWDMPLIDGKMLCQCLRSQSTVKYQYIILMTGHSELLSVVEGLGSGADDYITKPINNRELLARMASGRRMLEFNFRLAHFAYHDVLTGVLNRRNLVSSLQHVEGMAQRRGVPISCMLLDIDRFQKVNESYGHTAGDQVLIQVADYLASRFRNNDLICRYGGEEFVVILADCDEESARQCAERCREEISEIEFDAGNNHLRITSSIGVAELRDAESTTQMIERADEALLKAKQDGRNRVVRHTDVDPISTSEPAVEEKESETATHVIE